MTILQKVNPEMITIQQRVNPVMMMTKESSTNASTTENAWDDMILEVYNTEEYAT